MFIQILPNKGKISVCQMCQMFCTVKVSEKIRLIIRVGLLFKQTWSYSDFRKATSSSTDPIIHQLASYNCINFISKENCNEKLQYQRGKVLLPLQPDKKSDHNSEVNSKETLKIWLWGCYWAIWTEWVFWTKFYHFNITTDETSLSKVWTMGFNGFYLQYGNSKKKPRQEIRSWMFCRTEQLQTYCSLWSRYFKLLNERYLLLNI